MQLEKVPIMQSQTPSVNKITPPRISGILPRERLYLAMDRNFERPAVWVNGEGGAGKSTLVAGYLDSRKIPCLWYQVDRGDADIATLFSYMATAVEHAAPDKNATLPFFTPEYQSGISIFAKRYFEKLFKRLPRPYAVVLDDYHEVPEEAAFHEVIRNGLFEIPEGINVVVISRGAPPLQMAHLRSLGRMSLTSRKALRFTQEETEALVLSRGKDERWQETASHLFNKTQGWAAGLVLMLDCDTSDSFYAVPEQQDALKVPEEVFQYFYAELFEKTEPGLKDFFLKTSFFQEIVPEAAQRLTGNLDAHRILDELSAKNYFTERREFGYRYHPLFRDFLLKQTGKEYSEESVNRIRCEAAILLEKFGRIEEAAGLFIEARNWPEISRLILKKSASFVAQGRHITLLSWLNTLPQTLMEENPNLLFQRGKCLAMFNPGKGKDDFIKAFRIYKDKEEWEGMLLSWAAVADLILFLFTDSDNTCFLNTWLSSLPLIEETLEQHHEFHHTTVEARTTLSMFKALSFKQTDKRRFQTMERRVHDYFNLPDHPDTNQRIQTGIYLVVHYVWHGEFVAAKDIVLRLVELSKAENVSDFMRITIKNSEALFALFTGECDTAGVKVSEALEMSQSSGVFVWDNHVTIHGAAAALSAGDLVNADKLFQKVASNLEYLSPMDKVYFYGMLSWKAKIEGNLDLALNHCKHVYKLFDLLLQTSERVVGHIFIADILLMKGEEHEAREHLEIAKDIARKIDSRLITFMCLSLEVRLCLDHGDEEKGLELLRTAMKIGRECSIMNFYGWHAPDMLQLCIKALETGIEVDYVQKLIVARNLVPATPPLGLDNWPWPVKVVTLGRFEVLVNNQPVKLSRKPSYKLMDMLKVLVSLGGVETNEEKVRDLLWPDSDGDMARDLFKVTLHRLRKLLGKDHVIRFKEGRIALDRRYVWADSWAFEYHIEAAQVGASDTGTANLHKAIVLYEGHFLDSEAEQTWQFSMRNRLHHKYLAAAQNLAVHYEKSGQLQTAINVINHSLEKDPIAEQLYQCLMTFYSNAGCQIEAINTYHRYTKTLAASGVVPSSGMEAVFLRISDSN